MSEEKNVYIGYVSEMKTYEPSGVKKWGISFKADQLDELKKYLTKSGNVNMDLVVKSDGAAFISVFNPRATNTYNSSASNVKTEEALPF
tara:strand:+ start:469 stop:735 length:267 start_codon:yes stop_codon:yes gene_type:complete